MTCCHSLGFDKLPPTKQLSRWEQGGYGSETWQDHGHWSGPLVGSYVRCSGEQSCPTAAAGIGCGCAVAAPLSRGKQDSQRRKTFSSATKLAVVPSSWSLAGCGAGYWLLTPRPAGSVQGQAVGQQTWLSKPVRSCLQPFGCRGSSPKGTQWAAAHTQRCWGAGWVPNWDRNPQATFPTAAASLKLLIPHSPRATSEVKHPSDSLGSEGGRQRHVQATQGQIVRA